MTVISIIIMVLAIIVITVVKKIETADVEV